MNSFATKWRTQLAGYGASAFRSDFIAGITVGVVAIPLGMALAIAAGVPPQHGLYTVIVAGFLIALLGGSRFNVSGPTAAFVVILLPIVQQYGLSGLLIATVMSGVILLLMGVLRLGQLVRYVPLPVTVGFTAGIGFVIAFLQLKDLLGLTLASSPIHFIEKVEVYFQAGPTLIWSDALVGVASIVAFILWSRKKRAVPPHLIALLVGTGIALVINHVGGLSHVTTLGEKFHYTLNGVTGQGIPPAPPSFALPWGENGLNLDTVLDLLPSAIAIALLGSIESLLCAVVADGMTKTRHNPNRELIGQGIGNIIAPFFAGIPATAAIARTATNIRAGANSRVASMIHAVFVLAAMIALSPVLSYVPMSALAGLLIMVAWNMSEAPHFVRMVKLAPRYDVAVLVSCFTLTVVFDMVVAVVVGMVLAIGLLVYRKVRRQRAVEARTHQHDDLLPSISVHRLGGVLYFGASEKVFEQVAHDSSAHETVVVDMSDVVSIDISALHYLEQCLNLLGEKKVYLVGLVPALRNKVERVGLTSRPNVVLADEVPVELRHAAHV
ncbi:C4-dicarboxylic acid transporter DauA [Parasalinivibrio latis]|uniref:C4-dicarboxylic acid transporter DauA n=1 Tax=Parasalinivibrio latis TaxID=2952610 RepID=UPI0030E2B5D8